MFDSSSKSFVPQALKAAPYLTAALFIWAGVSKALFPAQAVLALESLDLPRWTAETLVTIAAAVEIYLAAMLCLKQHRQVAIIGSMVCLLVFTGYLFYLSRMANPPSCGCLGLTGIFKSNKQAAIIGLLRNGVLIATLNACYLSNQRAELKTSKKLITAS